MQHVKVNFDFYVCFYVCIDKIQVSMNYFILENVEDTQGEKKPPNKTQALTKNVTSTYIKSTIYQMFLYLHQNK